MGRKDFTLVPDVEVDDLLLDVGNARIRTGQDQRDCVERILRKEDQLLALARDIAENGLSTAPIIAKPNGEGQYVVMDGNRRLTALKLLNDPESCPDERLKPTFRQLQKKHAKTIPKAVDVLSSTDQVAIGREILLRHSGEQAGVGQVEWSSYLRTVYLINHGHPPDYKRAGQYALWAEGQGIYVADEFPITSLARFFTTENLLLLGFKVENDELALAMPPDAVKRIAQTLMTDFTTSVKVDDVRTPELARAYIAQARARTGLPITLPPAAPAAAPTSATPASAPTSGPNPSAAPSAPASATPASAPPAPTQPRAAPTPKTPSWDRNKLLGRSPGLAIPDDEQKAKTIVAELRDLNVKETPLAVGMLLRALIEISDRYYRAENKLVDKQKLAKNIQASADHMRNGSKLVPEAHDIVRRYCSGPDTLLQIETLQMMVHKGTHHPNYQLLNTMWDELAPFVRACWAK